MAPTTDPSTVFPAPFTDAMIMTAALCSPTTAGADCRTILTPHGAAARDAYEKQCRPSKCPDMQTRYDQVMADRIASRKDYVQAGEDLQTCGINACPAQFVAAYSMVCVRFTEPALQAFLTPSRLLSLAPSYVPEALQAEWNQTRHNAQIQAGTSLGICTTSIPIGTACSSSTAQSRDGLPAPQAIAPVMYQTENDRLSVGPLVTNSTPPQLFVNKARIPSSGVLDQTFPLNYFTPGPCVNGAIVSPRFMDDSCSQDAECLLGSCYGNVCRAKTRSLLAAGVFDAVSNATLSSTNASATSLPTDDLLGVLPPPSSISPGQIALILTAPVLLILLALAVWRRQLHVEDDDDDDAKSGVVVVDAIDPTAPAAREARLSPADPRMLDDVESAINSRRSSMSGVDLSLPNYSPYSALRPLPSTAPPSYPPSTRSTIVGAYNGGPNITAMSSLRHEVDIPPWASSRGTPRPSPRISPRPSPRVSVESTTSARRSAYDDQPWESGESFEMMGTRRRRGVNSRPGSRAASPRRSSSRSASPRRSTSRSASPRLIPSRSASPHLPPSRSASPHLSPSRSGSPRSRAASPRPAVARSRSPRPIPSRTASPRPSMYREAIRASSPRPPVMVRASSPRPRISRAASPRPASVRSARMHSASDFSRSVRRSW